MRRIVIFAGALVLAACGKVGPLEPAQGQSLPVKPAMATRTPTPGELLTPPAQARPERVDELMKRSEPRHADRFDLPPPSGEAPTVPQAPVDNSSENVMVTNPQ